MKSTLREDFWNLQLAVGRLALVLYQELVKPLVDWLEGWLERITERLGGDN